MRRLILIALVVLVLAGLNYFIYQKEQILSKGELLYLRLAPVDPRSLMQGDYMILRFELARKIDGKSEAPFFEKGRVVIQTDERSVGKFARLDEGQPLAENERILRYRFKRGRAEVLPNGFFFQEGHGEIYEGAKFGIFRLGQQGEALLVGLANASLKQLGPEQ